MDVGCNLLGFGGRTNRQNNKKTRQKLILASKTPTSRGILALGWTHMPIHSISRCQNTFYIYDMDVGCSLWGFGGLTNRQNKKKTHQNCMLASKTRKKT